MSAQGEITQMISDCTEREGKLTDWELSFIASIDSTVARGHTLTTLQQERLDEIWEKIT